MPTTPGNTLLKFNGREFPFLYKTQSLPLLSPAPDPGKMKGLNQKRFRPFILGALALGSNLKSKWLKHRGLCYSPTRALR